MSEPKDNLISEYRPLTEVIEQARNEIDVNEAINVIWRYDDRELMLHLPIDVLQGSLSYKNKVEQLERLLANGLMMFTLEDFQLTNPTANVPKSLKNAIDVFVCRRPACLESIFDIEKLEEVKDKLDSHQGQVEINRIPLNNLLFSIHPNLRGLDKGKEDIDSEFQEDYPYTDSELHTMLKEKGFRAIPILLE